jgi:hypothetical protein
MRNTIIFGLVFMFSGLFASNASPQTAGANTLPAEGSLSHTFVSCATTVGPMRVSLSSEPAAPYSAIEEYSSVQTLSDGTHITPKPHTSKTYRDSLGRTRDEQFCASNSSDQEAMMVVIIRDPVAGVGYVLDVQNHIAHRFAGTPKPGTARPLVTSGSVRDAVTATLPDRPSPSGSAKERPSSESEPLGTQTIEGLAAEGTRTTETIPANTQNNERSSKQTKTAPRACPFPPMGATCSTPNSTRTTPVSCSSIISAKASAPRRGLPCTARAFNYSHGRRVLLFDFLFFGKRKSQELTRENMAVLAPMPRARVRTATAAKPGFLRSWRRPKRQSETMD